MNASIADIVIEYSAKYPQLSISDLANMTGLPYNVFSSYRHALGIKKDRIKPVGGARGEEIRKRYSTGEYSLADLGREYGLTRERIRQIAGDLSKKIQASRKAETEKLRWGSSDEERENRIKAICEEYGKCNVTVRDLYKKYNIPMKEISQVLKDRKVVKVGKSGNLITNCIFKGKLSTKLIKIFQLAHETGVDELSCKSVIDVYRNLYPEDKTSEMVIRAALSRLTIQRPLLAHVPNRKGYYKILDYDKVKVMKQAKR